MKKQLRKLELHRETLRRLEEAQLRIAGGDNSPPETGSLPLGSKACETWAAGGEICGV